MQRGLGRNQRTLRQTPHVPLRFRILLGFRRCRRCFAQDPGRRDGEGREGRRHDWKRCLHGDFRVWGVFPRRLDAHPHDEDNVPPDRGLGRVGVENTDSGGEEALHGAGGGGQSEQCDGGRAYAEDERDDRDQ